MKLLREFALLLLMTAYATDNTLTLPADKQKIFHLEEVLAKYFSHLASVTIDQLSDLPEEIPAKRGYIDSIVKIALHLSQRTYVGYYSLIFNYRFRHLAPDITSFGLFWSLSSTSSDVLFPELSRNSSLSSEEKERIKERFQQEFTDLKQEFQEAISTRKRPQFFQNCAPVSLETSETQCHQVCIEENYEISSEPKVELISTPVMVQEILEGEPGEVYTSYCLPTKDLLITFLQNQRNPLTKKEYSSKVAMEIRHGFGIELKMVAYSLQQEPQLANVENISTFLSSEMTFPSK